MISWASKKLWLVGLIVASFSTISSVGFLNAPVHADAVSGSGSSPGIAELTDRWLRYRAVAGCYASTDIGKTSIDKITAGTWFQKSDLDYNVATGYTTGGDDRKVSCGDGAFVTNSLQQIGFSSNIDSFCSMSTAVRDGSKDDQKCIDGPGDFDMDGSKTDQFDAFKDAKAAKVSDSPLFPYSINDAGTKKILYWVGRQTLIKACGGVKGEAYVDSMEGNVRDSKRKVVVNEVNMATGEVERFVYNLNRDEGDTINDVWSETGGGNASSNINSKDMTCAQLAQLTWENDDAFGSFVKAYNTANPDDAGTGTIDGENPSGSTEPVCTAGGLGWVICPLINTIASMNDGIYAVIENMLVIEPVTVEVGGPLYNSWTKFRDIANVLFVVTFFFVIFSQATSVGLSSYGIKKLLPRIIAAAILVNLSFFLCQIAIDFSNIIGVSIDEMFASLHSGSSLDINVISWESLIAGLLAGGAIWGGAAVVLGAGGITAAIVMILPFLVTALFAAITAIAVLIARQVLIVLLVVLAPLAFVAFILPNTQKYFQLWQNTFTTMLVMFPLIAALFAGSQLAANIVLTSPTSEDGIGIFTLIAAVSMLFIPLFGVPYIVKFSGGLLGRVAGIVNNPNKGPFDSLRKKAESTRDRKINQARTRNGLGEGNALQKNTFGRYTRRQTRKKAENESIQRAGDEAMSGYVADEALNNPKFAARMTGGKAYQGSNFDDAVRKVQAMGISREREESRKRVAMVQQRLLSEKVSVNTTSSGALDFSSGMGKEYADAAARGDHETMSAVLQETHKQGGRGRQAVAQMLTTQAIGSQLEGGVTGAAAKSAQFEVQETVYGLNLPQRADLTKGSMDSGTGTWKPAPASSMGSAQIAGLDKPAMQKAVANDEIFRDEAQRIIDNENLKEKIQDAELETILRGVAASGPIRPPQPGGGGGPAPSGGGGGGGGPAPSGGGGGGPAPSGRVSFNYGNNPPPPSAAGPGPAPSGGPSGPAPSGGGGGPAPTSGGGGPAPSGGGPAPSGGGGGGGPQPTSQPFSSGGGPMPTPLGSDGVPDNSTFPSQPFSGGAGPASDAPSTPSPGGLADRIARARAARDSGNPDES